MGVKNKKRKLAARQPASNLFNILERLLNLIIGNSEKLMEIAISWILLAASLWIILSGKYDPIVQHFAFGIIGTIVGFWFGKSRLVAR